MIRRDRKGAIRCGKGACAEEGLGKGDVVKTQLARPRDEDDDQQAQVGEGTYFPEEPRGAPGSEGAE